MVMQASPHLESRPEGTAPPSLMFLLFHGVGGTPQAMAPFRQALGAEYPDALLVSVAAPQPFDGGGPGRQWFSVVGINEDNRPQRVATALPGFIGTVRELQARHAMPWQRTALVGFSQGAIMALEAVQAEPQLAGRVLAFSGRHATPPDHAPADTCVHLLHGLDDRVVPPGPAIDSAERLVALGGDVTADVLPGIGHEPHPQLIAKAIEQLRGFLPKRVWRDAVADAPLLPRAASSRELGEP
jgi:phospholipase/carboxylesterase